MTMVASESLIRTRFDTMWTLTDYAKDGVPFRPTPGQAYVALFILPGEGKQVEMGILRRIRRIGLIDLQIFVPTGTGTGQAGVLTDAFADIFELRTISGVIFRAMSVARVGAKDAWTQYNASIPYQEDDLR